MLRHREGSGTGKIDCMGQALCLTDTHCNRSEEQTETGKTENGEFGSLPGHVRTDRPKERIGETIMAERTAWEPFIDANSLPNH